MEIMAHKRGGRSHRLNLWDHDPASAQRLTDLEKLRKEAEAKIREIDAQEAAILQEFRNNYATSE